MKFILACTILMLTFCAYGQPRTPKARPATCTGNVLNKNAIYLPIPIYPQSAKASLRAQTVTVRVKVRPKGWIFEPKACSGNRVLHEAAERAALRAKVRPTILNGQAVETNGVINYRFDPVRSFEEPFELPCFPTMNIIKFLNEFVVDLVKPKISPETSKIRGSVAVLVTVDEMGKAESVKAVSGNPEVRKAAADAASKTTFRRFVKCGSPAKLTSVLGYNLGSSK